MTLFSGRAFLIAVSLPAAMLVVAGCKVGPDYKRPDTPVPPRFAESATGTSSTQPSTRPVVPVDVTRWWQAFQDPTLDALVERSAQNNLDLRAATARVRE